MEIAALHQSEIRADGWRSVAGSICSMDNASGFLSLKKDWNLTGDAFEKLLAWLDPDRDRAGDKYEEIRRRLMKFFEWQSCAHPEEHTDETINRVARKIDEGVEVRASDPFIYFSGVARNVLRERRRAPLADKEYRDGLGASLSAYQLEEASLSKKLKLELHLNCLESCLEELPLDSRQLILDYYKEDKHVKIEMRKRQAQQLGIPLNALRIRSLRIRQKLETCIERCIERPPGGMK